MTSAKRRLPFRSCPEPGTVLSTNPQAVLGPCNCYSLSEVSEWSRRMAISGPYQVPANVRYGIGIYQIYQGILWEGSSSEEEAFCAAIIHFVGALEMLNCPVQEYREKDFSRWPLLAIDWKKLMLSVAGGQQEIHYGVTTASTIKRKSRYNPAALGAHVGSACQMLLCAVKPARRTEAFYEAMSIMSGVL